MQTATNMTKCDGKFILSLKHSIRILLETKTEMCSFNNALN
jgi:hypothetical protein